MIECYVCGNESLATHEYVIGYFLCSVCAGHLRGRVRQRMGQWVTADDVPDDHLLMIIDQLRREDRAEWERVNKRWDRVDKEMDDY